MAKLSLLFLFLSFLCLSNGCFGQRQQGNDCQIQRLNPQEPRHRIQAEAGVTELWDRNDNQFRCAGVAMLRHTIQPKGLLLPSYTSFPSLIYVQQGRGFFGLMIPGCPETFQSSQVQIDRKRRFHDQHQKIGQFREGDILAVPAGAAHWIYNEGDQELVLVVLEDARNNINQLDQNPRRFFIAGNPVAGQGQQGGSYGQQNSGNVFRGFDEQTLAEAFNVDIETARKLQCHLDQRGHTIRIEQGLQVLKPPVRQEEQDERQESEFVAGNGLEETICTARVRQNIDDPSRADVYNPKGGRLKTVNSFTLPILGFLQLSAERGVLYRNAIMAPHWTQNSHRVIYATRGEARVQIVDHRGQAVFDGQLRKGQLVVLPMNFAAVKQAGNQGFEWVGFNTNDNAMIQTLIGRTSALRGLPASVIANSYQISEEQALKLKFSRDETIIFTPGFRSPREIASE